MKILKLFFFMSVVLLISSCGNENEEVNQVMATEEQGDPLSELILEAPLVFDENTTAQPKGMPYIWGSKGGERDSLSLPEKLYSLCIISNGNGTKQYYLKLTWDRTPGKQHYSARRLNVKDVNNQNINISGSGWSIKGFFTSTESKINTSAKTISYAPNGTGTAITLLPFTQRVKNSKTKKDNHSDNRDMDIPFCFDWAPLTIKGSGANVVASNASGVEPATPKPGGIIIKPFGVLARISLNNEQDYAVRIKSLRLMSNVVTPMAGLVEMTKMLLPNGNPPAGMTQATASLYPYRVATADPNDYSLTIGDGPINLPAKTSDKNVSHTKSYLIWLMPQTATAGTVTRTHLLADVSRVVNGIEMTYPKMKTLYLWGSDSNSPKHQSRIHMAARVYRPKAILEYISNGYKQGKNKNATFGTSSSTVFTYDEIFNYVPIGWQLFSGQDYTLLGLHQLNGSQIGSPNNRNTRVVLHGEDYSENATWQKVGNTVYALRFNDGDRKTKHRQYAAWRYITGTPHKIECVYLGPNFTGNFDDIKKAEFWTLHQNDIVTRSFATAQTKALERRFLSNTTHTFSANLISWASDATNGTTEWKWIWNKHDTDIVFNAFRSYNRMTGVVKTTAPLVMLEVKGSGFPNN